MSPFASYIPIPILPPLGGRTTTHSTSHENLATPLPLPSLGVNVIWYCLLNTTVPGYQSQNVNNKPLTRQYKYVQTYQRGAFVGRISPVTTQLNIVVCLDSQHLSSRVPGDFSQRRAPHTLTRAGRRISFTRNLSKCSVGRVRSR